MAYPNQVNVPRFDRQLRHAFNMKEQAVAPAISPDIQTSLILENDRPEMNFPAGTKLCGGSAGSSAVAGQFSHVMVHNPLDSQKLVVVTEVVIPSLTDVMIGWHENRGGSTNNNDAFIRDTRWFDGTTGSAVPTAAIFVLEQVGLLFNKDLVTLAHPTGGGNMRYECEVILQEDHALIVAPTAVNVAVRAAFCWYERNLEPLERGLFSRLP